MKKSFWWKKKKCEVKKDKLKEGIIGRGEFVNKFKVEWFICIN